MGMLNIKRSSSLQTVFAALLGLTVIACSDDSGTTTGGPVITLPDGSTHSSIDAGSSIDSGLPGSDAGTDGAKPADPGTGSCSGANNCYACKPATSLQFLNACASGCRPFDNSTRIPGFTGTLPPL